MRLPAYYSTYMLRLRIIYSVPATYTALWVQGCVIYAALCVLCAPARAVYMHRYRVPAVYMLRATVCAGYMLRCI